MKALIIHLSDIHLENSSNHIVKIQQQLFDAIKNNINDIKDIFLVVTGDIVFSGKDEEYKIAKEFFEYLKQNIENYPINKAKCNLVFIPGNHDCHFDESKEAIRKILIESFETKGFKNMDEESIKICCAPQEEFFKFRDEVCAIDGESNQKLLSAYTFIVDKYKVRFLCYNTAWQSKLKEKPGKMIFPIKYFDESIFTKKADVIVSLIHHPFNWNEPMNSREVREHIEQTSNIVLSGHEHYGTNSARTDFNKNKTIYIESPALQIEGHNTSGFKIIHLDFESHKIKVATYSWKKEAYFPSEETDWVNISDSIKNNNNDYQLNDAFKKFLDNPGANFRHSQANEIKLEDIFVIPDLKEINIEDDKRKKTEIYVNASKVFDSSEEKFRIILIGDQASGKTALCKYIFKKYYNEGYVPIFIKGEDIASGNIHTLNKLIIKKFEEQYYSTTEILQLFTQIDRKKLLIILDDYQNIKLKISASKAQLIESINNIYPHVFITADSLFHFEPFTHLKSKKLVDAFDSYAQYSIAEFGPTLRHSLIEQWYLIGQEFLEPNEFRRKKDEAQSAINHFVSKGLTPAYPFYLLSILQSIEAKAITPDYSLHGYCYQFLIHEALNTIPDGRDTPFYHDFLTEYAFFLHTENIRHLPLSIDSMEKFYENFLKESDLKISFEKTFDILVSKTKLLATDGKNAFVSHKYIYYYFVAKYFAERIHIEEIQERIEQLCKRLHREEFANIIMFLAHLTPKNEFLTDILKRNASSLFNELPVTKLEEDVSFINKLIDDVPEQVMKLMDVDEARKEELKDMDEVEKKEREEQDDTLSYDINEDITKLDFISKLILSLKTIEILGQITKRYWSSKGDKKLDLVKETYFLGLRTLKFYLTVVESNQDVLAEHLKNLIDKKHIKERFDAKGFSTNYLFSLCFMASYGIVRKISSSIGDKKLSQTFERMQKENDYNSVKLINLSIKLDYKFFPLEEMEKYKDQIEKRFIAKLILQNLIINYFRMYDDMPHDKVQKICNRFSIRIQNIRFIKGSSKVKKTTT